MANEEIIGIKELHRELKSISERVLHGEEFIVVRSSKPVFRIVPIHLTKKVSKKYKLKDFQELQFDSKNKTLSRDIDKILYFE